MFRRLLRYQWIPTIIALIIFYLCCLIPPSDVPEVELDLPFGTDKVVHFLMYFGLSGASALFYIYDNKGNIRMNKLLIGAFLIPILYGGLIEILQANFFAPRSGDWNDFFADILGSLAALPIVLLYRNKLLKSR